MILDSVSNSHLYEKLGPRFVRAFEYLRSFKSDTPDGKYELDGDKVYALVQSYNTSAPVGKKFESHQKYIDVQFVAKGVELLEHAPIGALKVETPYVAKDDYLLYDDSAFATSLRLKDGEFAIFFPNDGHKPCCSVDKPAAVKKVVVKVQV